MGQNSFAMGFDRKSPESNLGDQVYMQGGGSQVPRGGKGGRGMKTFRIPVLAAGMGGMTIRTVRGVLAGFQQSDQQGF